jgi:hypothetical protein
MRQRVLFIVFFCASFFTEAQDTVLKLYRPYGEVSDQALPAVTRSVTGRCMGQSRVILREDAWRCKVGDVIHDPCFIKAGKNRTEAVCPQSPWVGESIQINLSRSLNNEVNQTLDMSKAYPWALELSDGDRCLAIDTKRLYDGMPIRYYCGSKNLLVGHLQRCKNIWSMLEKTPGGVITAELVRAWF